MIIISGKKATTATILPRLFHNQNLVLSFSLAGSIWLAFFHNIDPHTKKIRSTTINIINHVNWLNLGSANLSKIFSIATTSAAIASTQRIIAPILLGFAPSLGISSTCFVLTIFLSLSSVTFSSLSDSSTRTILFSFFIKTPPYTYLIS